MKRESMEKAEKKVEYLELVYDLIFVYVIGRNSSLLQSVQNGFVSGRVFLTYILCSLAVIQIWNFSTFYTNMYGRNSVRDHVFMFVNMYLLYYIGEGTRLHWESFRTQYRIAWALILVNIGIQYLFELRSHKEDPEERRAIRGMLAALFGEAAIVLLAIPAFDRTWIQLDGAAILYGITATRLFSGRNRPKAVDFPHLTERAMLYAVFTFGEMIIAVASYFEGSFTANAVYFSTMSFLIVVCLFLGYEMLYDHILDREKETAGMGYMLVHIFLIFAMNIITASLGFMRDEAVRLLPKILLIAGAFLLYYLCLFGLMAWAKEEKRHCGKLLIRAAVSAGLFVVLMIALRERMSWNIFVSVVYTASQFLLIRSAARA